MAIIKIAKFWPGGRSTAAATAAAVVPEDVGLAAFGSETDPVASRPALALASPRAGGAPPAANPAAPASRQRSTTWIVVAAAAILSAAVAAAAMWALQRRLAVPAPPSQLTLETTPAGLEVSIGGVARGRTPVTLPLPPGTYEVTIGAGAAQRTVQATVTEGSSTVQRVEMAPPPAAAPPAAVTGSLVVQTDPARLPVLVDGVEKGFSPITIGGLEPGAHQVVVRAEGGAIRRSVTVQANQTVSLVVSTVNPSPSAGGWLTVSSPIPVQLRQGGRVVGTSEVERVMLPAGEHTLELVNEALGYRAERRVTIAAGGSARLAVDPPKGVLHVNAQPWAEVWLGSQRLGETPIGNHSITIGTHEVIFRHPQFGERRESVTVTTKQPARIGVDMRRK